MEDKNNQYNDIMNDSEEDIKLKELFCAYDPRIKSDYDFMSRLEQRLDSVEYIRRQTAKTRRNSRLALAISMIIGFLSGIVFTLAVPYAMELFVGFFSSFPKIDVASASVITSWLAAGAFTVAVTLSVYDISLAILKHRAKN